MEDTILLYVLLFPTFLNTLLLIALVVILYRTATIIGNLANKIDFFLERGKEEIFSTSAAIRNAATQGGRLLEKTVAFMDQYLLIHSFRQPFGGGGGRKSTISQLTKGVGLGISVYRMLAQFLQRKKER